MAKGRVIPDPTSLDTLAIVLVQPRKTTQHYSQTVDWDIKHQLKRKCSWSYIDTVKTLYSVILYYSKILYNVNCICTNLEFEFITTQVVLTSNYLGTNSVDVKRVD